MEINTFWKIVLKFIGLWLIVIFFSTIPQIISTLSFAQGTADFKSLVIILVANTAILIALLLIIRVFLFKTDWLLQVLKLEKGFNQQRIDLSISTSTVLSIAVIIISAVIFLDSLPQLIDQLLEFFKQHTALKDYKNTTWLIYYFIRSLASYLALTNSATIVKWINKKATENNNIQ